MGGSLLTPSPTFPTTLGMAISKRSLRMYMFHASQGFLFLFQTNKYKGAPPVCEGSKREVSPLEAVCLGTCLPGKGEPPPPGRTTASPLPHTLSKRESRRSLPPFPRRNQSLLIFAESLHTHLVAKTVSGITGTFLTANFLFKCGTA